MRVKFLTAALLVVGYAATASAVPYSIDVFVGDNDGYGVGIADGGATGGFAVAGTDNRSAAEAAATDGAQITDIYSALFPGFGPSASEAASVVFALPNVLLAGTLTVDMADFQASDFGAIAVDYNGVAQSWAFDDGFQASAVRSFVLTQAVIDAANAAGELRINLDHTGSSDFIAFDYFRLEARVAPEPATFGLFALGAIGLVGVVRRRRS